MAKKVTINKIENTLNEYENKKLTPKLINEIIEKLNSPIHQKTIIDENGNKLVWCNFHQKYEPEEKFKTKLNKKGVEVYKSNCIVGEKILRNFRSKKRKIEGQILQLLRNNEIDQNQFNKLMDKLDTTNPETIDQFWD